MQPRSRRWLRAALFVLLLAAVFVASVIFYAAASRSGAVVP